MKNELRIKTIKEQDIRELWEMMYGPKSDLEWMKSNGPYFQDPIYSWEEFLTIAEKMIDNPNRAVIVYKNQIIGTLSASWEDGDLHSWLEFGIVIFDTSSRGKGIGKVVLTQWISRLFELYPDIQHLGFSTYSGNIAMIKLGESCGLQLEARVRKVRFWQNEWFDSIKYGILREEWELINKNFTWLSQET